MRFVLIEFGSLFLVFLQMKISRSKFYALIYAVIALAISMTVMPLYIKGDQVYYRDFYKTCFYESHSFAIQYDCYSSTIGSSEPIYFFIAKMAHWIGLEKDLFINISNFIFIYLLVLVVLKYYKVVWHRHILIALLLLNYYILVMFFSAERLKFSFILMLLAILVSQSKKLPVIIITIVTHVQSLLLFASYFIVKFLSKSDSLVKKVITVVSTLIFLSAALYFMRAHMLSKIDAYSDAVGESGLIAVAKTAVFLVLTLISTRKILPVIAGLPLVTAAFFIGSNRVAILAFFLYLIAVIYYKRRLDILLLVVLIYYAIKSIDFIQNIFEYGTGYY